MTLLGPYAALGCPFEVEASAPIAQLLAEVLQDLRGNDAPRRRLSTTQDRLGRWTVALDGERPFIGTDIHHALYNSLSAINSLAAREGGNDCAVLHGGSVAVDGHGVVFVGHSRAGKSTLTAAMALVGHAYVADEVTAITSDTAIRAFHRPVGLRSGGAAALGLEVPAGPFDLTYPLRMGERTILADGAPLTQIVIVDRILDANSTELVGVTRLEPAAALFLLANYSLARGVERETFRRLDEVVRQVPAFVLRYSDVHHGVEMIEPFARGQQKRGEIRR